MQKIRVPISNFQFGEVSPAIRTRTDTAIYAASGQTVENLLVMAEGSLKKRLGLKHIYEYGITYDADNPAQSHLYSFVFDDNEKYVISVEHQKIRCFSVGDSSVTLVDTITTDTDGAALPFDQEYLQQYTAAQYGDVMFICHPLFAPRMLTRTSLTTFELSVYTFDLRADNKVTYQPYTKFHSQGVTLDPSASTGSGVTFTTSEAYFTSDHVGSVIRYHKSEIEITGYTSSTQVTGTIIDELKIRLSVVNPLRTTEGSAVVEVTHIDHGFAGGESITIEGASATGGINSGNINGTFTVGDIIDDNTYTYTAGGSASSSEDGGGIVYVVSHAPTTDWDEQAFSAVRGYPAAIVFHENRLVFAGTIDEPDSIWMSKIGEFFNFDVGKAEDTDSIALVAATGDVNEIRYLVSNRDLQIFATSGELYIPSFQNQSLTPTNAQIKKQTPFGAEFVEPVSLDGATLFVQKGGSIVREFLFTDLEDAYTSTAVSTVSSHLIEGPQCMAIVHSGFGLPESYAALTLENGKMILFTSNRAEKRAAWTQVTTAGNFCSVTAINERLFANIWDNDGKLRLCEFEGEVGLDMYIYEPITSDVVDVSSVYTDGDTVDVIGKTSSSESYLGEFTVNSNDEVDLSAYTGLGFTNAYVGRKFTATYKSNPIDASIGNGPATGEPRGVSSVVVDFTNTQSAKVNNSALIKDGTFDGKKEFRLLGYSRDPYVTIEQNEPMPLQINGITVELVV